VFLGERQFWNSQPSGGAADARAGRAPSAMSFFGPFINEAKRNSASTGFQGLSRRRLCRAEDCILHRNGNELATAIPGAVHLSMRGRFEGAQVLKIDGKLPNDKTYPCVDGMTHDDPPPLLTFVPGIMLLFAFNAGVLRMEQRAARVAVEDLRRAITRRRCFLPFS